MEQFEDQVLIEARDIVSSRSKKPSTEVVPFLVPAAKNAKVIIGDRDIDSVSELEEEMSVGSPEEESEEDEDAVIPASVTRAAEAEPRSRLQLVSRPGDTRAEAGRVVAMSCEVTGDKPIGEWPASGRDTWHVAQCCDQTCAGSTATRAWCRAAGWPWRRRGADTSCSCSGGRQCDT